MVVGDSKDGRVIHFQVFYHLAEFLSGARTWGLYPALGNAKLDLVPADYVARAVLAASDSDASVGRVLHLCSGRQGAVSLQGLRTIVREKFRRVGRRVPPAMSLPAPVFRAMLAIAQRLPPGGHSRALSTLPVFLDYLAEEQWFANAQTRAFLEGRGVALPPASQFLDPVLDYYLAHRG
jgi:nucleoside-diphosphate-sugar epimerase